MTVGFHRYDNYAQLLAGGAGAAHTLPDLDTGTIKMTLLNTASYAVDFAAHQDLADVPAPARIATVTLMLTVVAGLVDGTSPVFTSLAAIANAFVIYGYTGTDSTSPLIAFSDEDAAGDPIALTAGGNKTIDYDPTGLFAF